MPQKTGEDGRPLIVGLTGNISTGKSTVAGMLAQLGAETIDADEVAHQVMRKGSPAYRAIVERFGEEVLSATGEIDRAKLGTLVFSDPAALKALEALVHPATLEVIARRIERSSAGVVVIEAIKLIEAGMADGCDRVWVTVCRPEQQVQRLVAGRGLSREEAELRVQAQGPPGAKIARADVVIDTSGSLAATRAQVQEAWDSATSRWERGPQHGPRTGPRWGERAI